MAELETKTTTVAEHLGLSLRDLFALHVAGGLVADPQTSLDEKTAKQVWDFADALMEARGAGVQ